MAGEVMFERAATLTSHLTAMGCIASARIMFVSSHPPRKRGVLIQIHDTLGPGISASLAHIFLRGLLRRFCGIGQSLPTRLLGCLLGFISSLDYRWLVGRSWLRSRFTRVLSWLPFPARLLQLFLGFLHSCSMVLGRQRWFMLRSAR